MTYSKVLVPILTKITLRTLIKKRFVLNIQRSIFIVPDALQIISISYL